MAKNNEKFVSRENAKTLWGYMVDLLTGKYTKPSGGIPKSDLESSVQTSLGKADSALQSYTETDPTVPSWAKATNKPSYTQDEVGDGTTYKRVSSTEKDTWNAKGTYSKPSGGIPKSDLASAVQTSLEKADSALQSETDPTVPTWAKQSSKPSYNSDEISDTNRDHKFATQAQLNQISTNQTNNLYALETGAKNLFRWNKWVNDCTVVGGTKTISNSGVMTLTSSSTNCYTEYEGSAYPDVEIPVKENEQYVMTWENWRSYGSDRGTVYVVFVGSTGAATASASAEVKKIEFTTPTGTTGLRVYIKQTANVLSENYSNFMICSKAVWDTLGHNYQPPSVSNYELTKLEAEDRAGLIECIDEGAKNEFIFGEFGSGSNANVSIANNAVTVSGTQAWAKGYRAFKLSKNTKYVLSFEISQNDSSAVSIGVTNHPTNPVTQYLNLVFSNKETGKYSGEFTAPIDTDIYFVITVNNSSTAPAEAKSITVSNIMVATKAEYDISPNYEPYALPNPNLTQLQSEDRAALAEEIDAGPKNKFDFASLSNPTLNNTTVTKTDSSIVVTSSGAYARAVYSFDLKAGTYKLRLSASDITNESGSDTAMFVGLYKSSSITSNNELCRIYCTTAGDKYVEFNHAGGTVYVAFYINGSSTSYINTYTISQMMICTEAAWKVSPKFVPYRPSWDLVGTLFPTSYTTPAVNSSVSSKLSIICGGYAKMGNLVTINMRVSVSDTISAGSQLFYNLPTVYTGTILSTGASVVACLIAFVSGSNGSNSTGAITYEGSNVPSALTIPMSGSALTAGTYVISATYLSA